MKPKKKKTYHEMIKLDEEVLIELLKLIDKPTLLKLLGSRYSDYENIEVEYDFHSCCGNEYCYCDFPSVLIKFKREIK